MENNIEKKENTKEKKRIKNLISVAILIGGMLIGSLFVDFVQLFRGGGFSQKNLNKTDVFEANGKTWAAFSEPIVNVKVITDDSCEACDPADVLVWSRRVMPTINAQKVLFDSEEGKKIIAENEIKFLPAFIFSETVKKTDFYSQAQILFTENNGQLMMNLSELGIEPGKYVQSPEIKDGDAVFGNKESKVKVVVFSDFQCSYCQAFHKSFREAMKELESQVFFVLKQLPQEKDSQSEVAALASYCALEQGKFWEYADKLYADQARWVNSGNSQVFKNYAGTFKLNWKQFSDCLDQKKYQDKINQDVNEALSFGISGTPAIFVNNNFQTGAVGLTELKKAIEEELKK